MKMTERVRCSVRAVRDRQAVVHVAEQHWNAAPAPKLADTND